jgi:tetratricopeptide (TPR) repeat protein
MAPVAVLAMLWLVPRALADDPADLTAHTLTAKSAVEPAAPVVPPEVVAAMQEGRYDAAIQQLGDLEGKAKTADDRAYFAYLEAIADRLAGRRDSARQRLTKAIQAGPDSRWAVKIRYELAGVEMAAGNWAAAEELARTEAVQLLQGTRKDRLAGIYRDFANRLLEPGDPLVQPDPKAAYEMLAQARELAESPELRASLLFAMGRAKVAAGDPAGALENFRQYLADYPKGADRLAVRFQLGLAEQKTNQALLARRTWTDLAREIERLKPDEVTKEIADIRALSLYNIASTFGIPAPPDDAALNQGVAAMRRFLAAFPAHPKAVRAAHQLGDAFQARGKNAQAREAFTRFLKQDDFRVETDEARRDWANLAMDASFKIGAILQGQQDFAGAIAAWKGYLTRFPNGPQSADAQRAILDTELMIAADHAVRLRFGEARTAWSAFVTQNPLDARVPEVLFKIGESHATEKKYKEAIAAWETLISKFPASEPAAHAQFSIAALDETELSKLPEAIELFKKITVEPWASQARQRVAVMEAQSLVVVTPRTYRSGETARLKIATRNIEELFFTAYKLNAEAYFRKKSGLQNVESLDIGLVAPDASWTAKVPDYARYKPSDTEYDLKKLEIPGVYVVKVSDEKTLQATTLVVGSDLDAIVKTSRDQILVFAQDMKTGQGRADARVLVAEGGQIVLDAKAGADGVLLRDWSPARAGNSRLSYLILDGPHVAGSGLGVPDRVAQGLTARAYIYTDRPAYRPGSSVAVRGIVREVTGGQYAYIPKAVYRFEVIDSRGRMIQSHPVTLSEFGTFHETLALDRSAPEGAYRVRVYQPGKSEFAGSFEVHSYQLEPIALAFDLKKTVYYRGETIEAALIARYQYGAPVANRPIEVALPDQRILHGMTDDAGQFKVELPTEGFADEQALVLTARLPQDNVATSASVMLAIQGFKIALTSTRDVYLDGESFVLDVTTTDAQGSPTGQSLSAILIKRLALPGRVTEREVLRQPVSTDAKTGRGTSTFRVDDDQGGSYILRVTGTDRFGNPIVADRPLTISGKQDQTRLRILADRQRYKVGEEATVNLHSRDRSGTALLTWEGDRILTYKIVTLRDGNNPVAWAIDGPQFPNFTLTAARMVRNEFDQAKLDVQVERDLQVAINVLKPAVGPGEQVEIEVTTRNQLGRPVPAELSLAVVDQSLLRLYADRMPAIGPFFFGQTRLGAFSTEATNTFRYAPATTAVAQAVVEERDLRLAETKDLADRERVLAVAKAEGARDMAGAAPAPNQPMAAAESAPVAVLSADSNGEEKSAGRPMAGFAGDKANKSGVEARRSARFGKNAEMMYRSLGGRVANGKVPAEAFGDDEGGEQARERFVETAYWNPLVMTGEDGKTKVVFKAPTALSEYQITARGITGADTLAGQTTSSVIVRKPFSVDLKVPSSLTQGDKPRFVGQVHHTGLVGRVALRLAVYAGGRDEVYPKTLDVTKDGIDDVQFEPFDVPEGESVRLTLTGTLAGASDELTVEVPIRPWGAQVSASESGTSRESTTVFVGLPPGRTYDSPEMQIVLSPTLKRMLIEMALGADAFPLFHRTHSHLSRPIWPPPHTTADRAADLLAATQALRYLRAVRGAAAPEAERLTRRIQGLTSALTAAQNIDGGWPWVSGNNMPRPGQQEIPAALSERLTSAAVLWSLASAEPLGLIPDVKVLDQALGYLSQEFAKTSGNDLETRAALLHALSTRRAAGFEAANSLNRVRNELSDPGLAYLALTFANLDRSSLAGEILGILTPRAKTEATAPGRPARVYWNNTRHNQSVCNATEATALVSLAFARVRPQAPELGGAIEWLLAHRSGNGWQPHKAKGAGLAALSLFYARAQGADDRYRLVVTVNDTKVSEIDATGASEGQAIAVPRKALLVGRPNRVRFEMEGRGRFGYAVTLHGFTRDFAPDQKNDNRRALVWRRAYYPAPPELDGKVLPTGFGTVVNPTPFENLATQVALGGKAKVAITAVRSIPGTTPEWERDFLVMEEHLPAGATLIEGSVSTSATSYELADGVLTFYFAPNESQISASYDMYGYLPGQYRVLPTSIRSAYEPGRYHLGPVSDLKVRAPGEEGADPYKPTPDELFARGQAHYAAGRLAEAGEALEPLFAAYTLRDDVAKDAARMLLLINIQENQPRKIVTYFEVVKEKAPELVLSFGQLMNIGRAYREINEYERAMIVWRGLIEASYLEDARVGELLRQRGKTLEAIAYLVDLWRSYPNTASIESDFFALSQLVSQTASRAFTDPPLRSELAAASITRSELILQAIRMIQVFLSQSPANPVADEASLALVGAFADLEDFAAVDRLATRFARIYPKSQYFDSFQFSEALANFHLGRYDRAIEVASKIAAATYKDAAGVDQPSPNKWQAVYILGQIHDARRQPGRALEFYRQVADRFTDAASAVQAYTRKDLKVPEVSIVRPGGERVLASDSARGTAERGLRVIDVTAPANQPAPAAKPGIRLEYRNVAVVDVKVYPVDLMQLYLTRRNLNGIAGIDLAGITPLVEKSVTLGSGADYDDLARTIDLPLTKEGAYLVMIRGDNLYASGIVLVTPLEMEVLEDPAGRVRLTVRDARSKDFLPKVQVKVIGSNDSRFISSDTDLRGVFVAEGVRGLVTAVARKGENQYAFYRGTTSIGPQVPVPPGADGRAGAVTAVPGADVNQSLDFNLKQQNQANSARQIESLQKRYNAPPGQSKGAPAGGFR